jgi:serine/threonine-protein kinase
MGAPGVQEDVLIGTNLGGYRIERLLGAGSSARIYLGRHDRLGRRAAIKVLDPNCVLDEEAASRFYCEARAVAEVSSPHLVDIYDFIFEPKKGRVAYVMEHLTGDTLRRALQKNHRVLPGARAARIAAQVCDALAAVHSVGVVHRDVRPENVMLISRGGENDFVKLIDFGVAQFAGAVRHHTDAGFVIGSPTYMAPEQARGRRVDERADVYSVGVMLHEMLTGAPPFVGVGSAEIIERVLRAPAPSCGGDHGAGQVPRALVNIVKKCLAKSPEARFASADLLRAALLEGTRLAPDHADDATQHIAKLDDRWTGRVRRAASRMGAPLSVAFASGVGLGMLIAALF